MHVDHLHDSELVEHGPGSEAWRQCQHVPSRESGRRPAQKRSSPTCSYKWHANQLAPHCRGRCSFESANQSRGDHPWVPHPRPRHPPPAPAEIMPRL
jgi:hypothetical protein